jgi:hypothetical protein
MPLEMFTQPGAFFNTVDFDPGTGVANLTAAGQSDIFISKLDASGNFLWARRIGGANPDLGQALALDAAGNVYVTGRFEGVVDFDPGAPVINLASSNADVFVLKLDAGGNLVWAANVNGSGFDVGNAMAVDADGHVLIAGNFSATADFDPGAG